MTYAEHVQRQRSELLPMLEEAGLEEQSRLRIAEAQARVWRALGCEEDPEVPDLNECIEEAMLLTMVAEQLLARFAGAREECLEGFRLAVANSEDPEAERQWKRALREMERLTIVRVERR